MNDANAWFVVPSLLLAAIVLFIILFRLLKQFPFLGTASNSVLKARGFLSLGRFQESSDECVRTLELDPNNSEAHWILARLHLEKGELDAALNELMQSTRLEPSNNIFWRDLGLILFLFSAKRAKQSQLDEALLDEAAMAFRKAWLLGKNDAYDKLHLLLMQAILGYPMSQDEELKMSGWQELVGQFYKKAVSEQHCLEQLQFIKNPDKLHFYIALYYLGSCDWMVAKKHFRSSVWYAGDQDAMCRAFLELFRQAENKANDYRPWEKGEPLKYGHLLKK
jgi:tetratricopeptide (TPR) repeat protein